MKVPSVVRLINVVCFLAILPVPCLALTPAQVFDKVKDTVVVVKTLDVHGKVKEQGSGVLVSSGRVATNCHVVKGGVSYLVGRGKEFVPATLHAADSDKDICLIDAAAIQAKPAQLGRTASLKVGDPVYAIGAPQGGELSLSDGIVAQLRGGPSPLIQTTAAISPGSSGGGLFDSEGRLVGLTTFYVEGGQSLNFAMPVEWISKVKPGRTPATEGRGHTKWLKHAIALETAKDWQVMRDWCQKWTKSEPENADAWNNLGIAYDSLYRYNDATEACCQAVRIDPKNASAWYNLGIACYGLNRYDDAIEAYRQAIKIDPKDAAAWDDLGNAYDELNRYDDAIEAYRQAIRIDPKDALAWYNLGTTCHKISQYDDAIEAYRQAIKMDPKLAAAWDDLGNAYDELNRHTEAIEAYRQAIKIDPKDALAWFNLGFAYDELNRRTDAIEAYRQAIKIHQKYAAAWNNLAIAYSLSGNKAAALSAAQELRNLDPAQADKLFSFIAPR
jgi:tetratricopeptide (TPR) repeat protein